MLAERPGTPRCRSLRLAAEGLRQDPSSAREAAGMLQCGAPAPPTGTSTPLPTRGCLPLQSGASIHIPAFAAPETLFAWPHSVPGLWVLTEGPLPLVKTSRVKACVMFSIPYFKPSFRGMFNYPHETQEETKDK